MCLFNLHTNSLKWRYYFFSTQTDWKKYIFLVGISATVSLWNIWNRFIPRVCNVYCIVICYDYFFCFLDSKWYEECINCTTMSYYFFLPSVENFSTIDILFRHFRAPFLKEFWISLCNRKVFFFFEFLCSFLKKLGKCTARYYCFLFVITRLKKIVRCWNLYRILILDLLRCVQIFKLFWSFFEQINRRFKF